MSNSAVGWAVDEAKASFVGAIRPDQSAGAVADTVSDIMVHTLRGAHAVGGDLITLGAATVTGVVQGAAQVGAGAGEASRPIMVGALRGTGEVGTTSVQAVSANAAAIVRATEEVGGSVGGAARGAVEGAIEAARALGMNAEDAASAAATGALKAAGAIGSFDPVRKALAGTISGVRVVLKEPFRHALA